jgi:hypothetical protein
MNVGKMGMLLLLAVAMIGSSARAGEDRPSQAMLEQMGLSGMTVMSDADAMSVRGHGFNGGHGSSVRVYGNSFATIRTKNGTAHSENGYAVSGKNFAAGANGSIAGVIHISSGGGGYGGGMGGWKPGKPGGHPGGGGGGGGGVKIHSTIVFAGGFSVGVAH